MSHGYSLQHLRSTKGRTGKAVRGGLGGGWSIKSNSFQKYFYVLLLKEQSYFRVDRKYCWSFRCSFGYPFSIDLHNQISLCCCGALNVFVGFYMFRLVIKNGTKTVYERDNLSIFLKLTIGGYPELRLILKICENFHNLAILAKLARLKLTTLENGTIKFSQISYKASFFWLKPMVKLKRKS